MSHSYLVWIYLESTHPSRAQRPFVKAATSLLVLTMRAVQAGYIFQKEEALISIASGQCGIDGYPLNLSRPKRRAN